jgi:hypothetical protein
MDVNNVKFVFSLLQAFYTLSTRRKSLRNGNKYLGCLDGDPRVKVDVSTSAVPDLRWTPKFELYMVGCDCEERSI